MKKYIITLIILLSSVLVNAQIPFYGTTIGENKTYTYLQWKSHPGYNQQAFYVSVKYGVYSRGDLSFSYNDTEGYNVSSFGWTQNIVKHKNINIAIQPMASFNMRDNFKFSDICTGLYLHGEIYAGLGYDLNTWWTIYRDGSHDVSQWSYLTYTFGHFSPMIGAVTSCTNNWKTDLALGTSIYLGGSSYFYIWGANLTKNLGNVRLILGIDYKF